MELLKDFRRRDWFWIENGLIDDASLNIYEKMIYIVLTRHTDNESSCFPSVSLIARKTGCGITTVKKTLRSLEEKKLIIKVKRKIDNKKENDTNLYYVMSLEGRSLDDLGRKTADSRSLGDLQVGREATSNNTNINNTNLTSNIYSLAKQKEDKTNDKVIHKIIIDYLNEKADKSFKSTTKKTRDLINARLKEGFVEEDFYKVIDNKVHAWLEDAKMSVYLRPETLFGNKFESYLNEVLRMAKNGNESVKQNKEVSKNKFANFEQTFTQYSNKELDEIIKKSQKAKFEK
ncbi:conserved phage C-terminal domain-containing protein [Clostridioides sp. ES-S-0006-03]|uniref:conserved phage C-terminal domain-containing protein n=1 Tax=Clostridioides sp. ES-S-0006-03 TaxID=2770775 RepID=UPI001D0CA183|nr:conserved phage C-terminal domain-containing protein [Clostridioides sp. ES-S-0006-03]